MKVLHICNDFCATKVHTTLYREFDRRGIEQTIYAAFLEKSKDGNNKFDSQSARFFYRCIRRPIHKYLYHKKIRDIYADLSACLADTVSSFDIVHATTLFSDGALAYKLNKEHQIPYIVAVRGGDINGFLHYAPHTWIMGVKILCNAKKIIFISKAQKNRFSRHPLIRLIFRKIQGKIVIQPNGIDSYWLRNIKTDIPDKNHNLLYVGRFDNNKNVLRLCQAVVEMKQKFPTIQLHLVGGEGSQFEVVNGLVKRYPETLFYHGKIYDKSVLKDVYASCNIFAMPSHSETFGLVYIEALTQHLAVIYTKGQGIDNLFDSRIGEAVISSSKKDIKKAIEKIISHRLDYLSCEVIDFNQFNWDIIASRYIAIYKECLNSN